MYSVNVRETGRRAFIYFIFILSSRGIKIEFVSQHLTIFSTRGLEPLVKCADSMAARARSRDGEPESGRVGRSAECFEKDRGQLS